MRIRTPPPNARSSSPTSTSTSRGVGDRTPHGGRRLEEAIMATGANAFLELSLVKLCGAHAAVEIGSLAPVAGRRRMPLMARMDLAGSGRRRVGDVGSIVGTSGTSGGEAGSGRGWSRTRRMGKTTGERSGFGSAPPPRWRSCEASEASSRLFFNDQVYGWGITTVQTRLKSNRPDSSRYGYTVSVAYTVVPHDERGRRVPRLSRGEKNSVFFGASSRFFSRAPVGEKIPPGARALAPLTWRSWAPPSPPPWRSARRPMTAATTCYP